jgi:TolA-binding protein
VKNSLLSLFMIMSTLQSCSWLSSREPITEAEEAAPEKVPGTVSREQYEQLLAKYEALAQRQNQSPMEQNSVVNRDDSTSLLQALKSSPIPADGGSVAPTVALEASGELRSQFEQQRESIKISSTSSASDIKNDLILFYQGDQYFHEQKWKEALEVFKKTEQSSLYEVRSWSKYLMGEIFFSQGEFDLAGQLFEEVTKQYAGSGVVVKAIGRLVVCAEKLGQPEKKDRYYSLLHDFFE